MSLRDRHSPDVRTPEERNSLILLDAHLEIPSSVVKAWMKKQSTYIRFLGKDEAEAIANVALVNAARIWDPDKVGKKGLRTKFNTYATSAIFKALFQAFKEDRLIRIPKNYRHNVGKEKTQKDVDRAMRVLSLDAKFNTTDKHTRLVDSYTTNSVDLKVSLADLKVEKPGEAMEKAEDREQERKVLNAALGTLDERSRRIVVAYCVEGKKLQEIGAELGITRERVRQVKRQALRDMRKVLTGRSE